MEYEFAVPERFYGLDELCLNDRRSVHAHEAGLPSLPIQEPASVGCSLRYSLGGCAVMWSRALTRADTVESPSVD